MCQYNFWVSYHVISLSNVKCQMSIVKFPLSGHVRSVDFVRCQKKLQNLSWSFEIPVDLVSSKLISYYKQSVSIKLAHWFYTDVQYFLSKRGGSCPIQNFLSRKIIFFDTPPWTPFHMFWFNEAITKSQMFSLSKTWGHRNMNIKGK